VIIEGFLTGNLSTDKDVMVGSKAEIKANVTAQNASIAGTINGSITINEHLTLKASALINGDIKTKSISVEQGARINGQVSMSNASHQPHPAKQA
jgi:cytoskeletal protein CcmA (bactofilin family)